MAAKKTDKKTSKSVEKRVAIQTEAKEAVAVETVDSKDVTNEILERLTRLETKQTIIIDSYAWAAQQVTGFFGMGGLGAVFDAISEKLSGK